MAKKKSSFLKKILVSVLLLFTVTGAVSLYYAYDLLYRTNVNLQGKKSEIIYIPTGSTFNDVMQILIENNLLKNQEKFEWLCEQKGYKKNIKPGKYRILSKMSNNALVNLLKAGIQEPVEIDFNGIRTKNQLIARVSKRIEADSISLSDALSNNELLRKYGLTSGNVMALFIPNTYEFYWNTSAEQFLEKMGEEYQNFWTESRIKKASEIKLSPVQVTILASIVQAEQCCNDEEKQVIAGLYMNRLQKNMLLQSDPTVIYAIGNFNIQRVSKEHLRYNSPYNTYKYKGLPPGPIGFAKASSIDAVLNYTPNNYIYMCAKEDLSGRHNFSVSYQQHCLYAQKYRDALDIRNIHGVRK